MKPENIIFLENPEKIQNKIKIFSSPEDIILLEGRSPFSIIKKLKE